MSKILWIMCGAPGSGKSYYAKNVLGANDTCHYISRDNIRYNMVKPNEPYFNREDLVYAEFVRQVQAALNKNDGKNVIVDATHLTPNSRMKLLSRLSLKNVDVIPVWMNTTEETCLLRNSQRKGRECVPTEAVRRMYHSRKHPKDDPFKYASIMEVDEE